MDRNSKWKVPLGAPLTTGNQVIYYSDGPENRPQLMEFPSMDTSYPIPKSLTILGQKFSVELVDVIDPDEPDTYGQMLGSEHKIQIRAGLSKEQQWQTLIHETVHATLHITGLASKLDDTVEEVIAQSVEYAMCQLIRQTHITVNEIGLE